MGSRHSTHFREGPRTLPDPRARRPRIMDLRDPRRASLGRASGNARQVIGSQSTGIKGMEYRRGNPDRIRRSTRDIRMPAQDLRSNKGFHSHHRSVKYVADDAIKQLIKLNCQLTKLTRSNCYADTLQLFKHLLSSPFLKPDHYTLSATLTACAHIPDVRVGNQLHAYSIHAGLKAYPHVTNTLLFHYAKSRDLDSVKRVFGDVDEPDVYSWTTLLSACAKLGEVGYACQVFDRMPRQNVALWNAIITGCTENGRLNIAFDLFLTMHKLGVMPDNYTLASVLSFCSADLGRQVHSLIIKSGFLDRTSVINSLVSMYFSCGNVMDAYEVFEEAKVGVCDQITYNAMINGLVSLGWDEEALKTFKDMLEACLRPTELTFS
ncbi:hypothetical protein Nepgr_016710 [Nepenthes gracilis]|uniref:Pentatricopeptide repeat-containing protein n=1 Tax=Nepenthes gracilis TaxID=150966 RepID=A0AAD3SQ74_NEPGR|nr:hypothetical protein Nepgr_016710 [Nepenthes gracilis]